MAQVEITINDRLFTVTCDDGQEQRLKTLAAHFDTHVSRLAGELGQIGDARLMLLSALTVCDELFEARARTASLENAADKLDAETMGGAARVIEAAAKRVETIASRLDA
ncbi:MAG: cell division protein ZapA [Pseudomonadota bacterium]